MVENILKKCWYCYNTIVINEHSYTNLAHILIDTKYTKHHKSNITKKV